ncbi:cation:proton antiporter [Lactonifactor longoviformis]|uniref:Sodium/proton-potassium antiporter GerN, CPA2 family (TC 2.A.37.2.2) n=1 Tax=Lactonifactor longoviformis DSM 17459 TaxID=1122155 RepID=A0A1M4Z8V5_9CLOT|nr:cation:proton antiporter [Lactonifactor longoviformis]POP34712.1 cation:proton antiporter [Lactonifactor longoviformis]SHF14461.1 sodium/proton-potassium antiporter GerN, CPA2 family (TC 2.A.37.2.2) [Lactonifactor longoviformis DSM 17459]
MKSYDFLLDLAIILLSTKLFGLLTRKIRMPQVVGALLAGLLLGPAVLGILKQTEFIHQVSEIGVIVLMFCAGLETDIDELKKSGKASFIIALMGVIVPLAGGFGVAWYFNRPGMLESTADTSLLLQNIFIGVILTATSVSITVETLKEMGKLNTKAGNAILGAAIIDDILGIIALTLITSMADPSVKIGVVLLKIAGFFVAVGLGGYLIHILFKKWVTGYKRDLQRFVIISFVICLIFAYVAEEFFGVADITGAFFAGLIITKTTKTNYIARRFSTLSYLLLSPVFFASIGIQVELPEMSSMLIAFSVILVLVAVLTKVVGCGLGAKMCRYSNKNAIRIGTGMISRGEVALIVAAKGDSVGLMSASLLGPVVVVVVITTIISPILLKLAFSHSKKKIQEPEEYVSNDLAKVYEDEDIGNQYTGTRE